jgi:K(+)-stimulated pyrophosphate-energized sodium pump
VIVAVLALLVIIGAVYASKRRGIAVSDEGDEGQDKGSDKNDKGDKGQRVNKSADATVAS